MALQLPHSFFGHAGYIHSLTLSGVTGGGAEAGA